MAARCAVNYLQLSLIMTGHSRNHEFVLMRMYVDITEQLASRQNAMNLIPGIVQHHVFNKNVIEMSRTKALDIIEQIDLLVADSVQ